ncbi:MAG: rRNA pseudouridine synthase [Clostridiales bacterium]|nr:rRNA pseudouridine synthase [Candidatus Cacconaster stercorequi]
MTERLQKLIARAGVCSRRAAEELLTAGRVQVNGHVAQLGDKADSAVDRIEIDGHPLENESAPVYLMLNKPRGYVTTLSDEYGRKTAAELVADCGVRVFPVGRLDRDSEGLLLFTNDGAWMQKLLHPKHEINKVYRVTVRGALDGAAQRLAAITDLDGEAIRSASVEELRRTDGQALLQVTIHEGKNRQIRRMCAKSGLEVLRLQRIQEDILQLGGLKSGKWRYLTDIELKALERGDSRDK